MKKIFKYIGTLIVILFIGYFGFNTFLVPHPNFDKLTVYRLKRADGQVSTVMFLKGNKYMVKYRTLKEEDRDLFVFTVNKIVTIDSYEHLIGPIFKNGFSPLWGYKIAFDAKKVIDVTDETIETGGNISPSALGPLGPNGTRNEAIYVIKDSSMIVTDQTYSKVQPSDFDKVLITKMIDLGKN